LALVKGASSGPGSPRRDRRIYGKTEKEKSKRNILRQRVVDLVVEFIKSEGGISQYDLQILFYNRSEKAVFTALDRMPIILP
jgi:hypothetical protein